MSMPRDGLVLHLISYEWQGDVPLLVSPGTVEEAKRATADDAPHPPMDFGDVRRSGDLIELEELLERLFSVSLEQYVAGIETAAGRSRQGGDLTARLAALDDVYFAGDDMATDEYGGLPADDYDFREELVAWDEPDVRYWDVIARATPSDLPSDLAEQYCSDYYATGSPGSSGAYIGSWVDPDRLDELITELEARGYVVIRDSAGA